MFFCRDCGKQFRDTYNLTKHMSRVRPCVKVNLTGEEKREQKFKIDSQKFKIDSHKFKIDSEDSKIDSRCQFCLHTFKSKWYKNNHEKGCKCKDDPVRLMEIEKGLDIDIPKNKLECRFCNLVFSKTSNLNRHIPACKDREKYIKYLQTPVNCTINNYNNNTTNNYNNINVNFIIGEENKCDMTLERVIEALKKAIKGFPDDQIRQIAAEFICIYDKMLKERPENHTMNIPHLNSMIAYIKQETGWEMVPIDKGIHAVVTNTASNIMEHRKELEAYGRTNRLTFQGTTVPMTPQIMDEVGYIKKNGIYTEQFPGSAKTAIKINNLI
jgi:hypothetical protein